MAVGVLIEVFGKMVFSFTRSVMEHYNPEEPAFTIESFGFNPLESTGREWYYPPVGELIYQEYGNEESTSTNYLAARGVHVRVINACSPEEPEEFQDDQLEDRSMAWKQLRPSSFQTICKSMYIGALISLFAATGIAAGFILLCYLAYSFFRYTHVKPMPLRIQWIRAGYDLTAAC